ncbi:MAG: hypothetical protein V1728_01865 [Candidatus Micrarchaeota archaeon]
MEEIRSDVDKIMDFLRSLHGQDASFSTIEQNTSLTHARVRKWIRLLEEKRQVQVRYHFTSERVRWIGAEKKTDEPAGSAESRIRTEDASSPYAPRNERAQAHIGARVERSYPGPSVLDSADYPRAIADEEKTAQPSFTPPGRTAQETEHVAQETGQTAQEAEHAAQEAERGSEPVEERAQEEKPDSVPPLHEETAASQKEAALEKETTPGDGVTPKKEERAVSDRPIPALENLPPRLFDIGLALGKTGPGRIRDAGSSSAKDALSTSSGSGMPTTFALQSAPRMFPKPLLMPTVPIPQPVRIEFSADIPLPLVQKNDPQFSKMNQKLKKQMALIGARSRRIAKLEAQKRRLLAEIYQPLEHKLDQDVQQVSGKLLDFEQRILDLHARSARLPDEMEDVSAQQTDMAEMSAQLQQVYDETSHVVSEALASLGESRESMSRHVELISAGVQGEERYLAEMTGTVNALGAMQAEVEARLSEARQAIEDEQARLREADGKLEALVGVKASLEAELLASSKEIRTQKLSLSELERHISRLDDVQRWVASNREEYDRKMLALADYIKNAQGDYSALKESIDASFARRYISELRNLSLSYEFEYAQAHCMEEDIDMRLSRAKEQLSALVLKARSIADLQEVQLAEISGPSAQRAKEGVMRGEKVEKAFLKDKGRERMRELILRTIEEAPEFGDAAKGKEKKNGAEDRPRTPSSDARSNASSSRRSKKKSAKGKKKR